MYACVAQRRRVDGLPTRGDEGRTRVHNHRRANLRHSAVRASNQMAFKKITNDYHQQIECVRRRAFALISCRLRGTLAPGRTPLHDNIINRLRKFLRVCFSLFRVVLLFPRAACVTVRIIAWRAHGGWGRHGERTHLNMSRASDDEFV